MRRPPWAGLKPPPWAQLDPWRLDSVGLVGLWPLNEEGSRTLKDATNRNNLGSLTSGVTWTKGDAGQPVLSFPGGSTHNGQLGFLTPLNGIGSLTFTCWIRARVLPFTGYRGIIGRGSNSTRTGWIFGLSGASNLQCDWGCAGGTSTVQTGNLTAGKWYHLSLVYDSAVAFTAYLNGIVSGTPAVVNGNTNSTDGTTYLGQIPGFDTWDGEIDKPRFYRGRAFNQSQIVADMLRPWSMFPGPMNTRVKVSVGAFVLSVPQPGNFALTGQTVGLKVGRVLPAAQGTLTLTGKAANLLKGFNVAAAQGSFSLSGQPANLLKGFKVIVSAGTFTLSGQAVGFLWTHRLAASAGTFALTGQSANLLKGFRVIAAAGLFTLTGEPATLTKSSAGAFTLAADMGTFTLAGRSAGLQFGRRFPVSAGSFSLSGQSAGLFKGFRTIVSAGSFVLGGQAAGLKVGRRIINAFGSFSLTGIDANLIKSTAGAYTLPVTRGLFVLGGQPANLLVGHRLIASPAAFSVTGQDASLRRGVGLTAGTGVFVVTGQPAAFSRTRRLIVSAGSFTLTGHAASLVYSAATTLPTRISTTVAVAGGFIDPGQTTFTYQ